MNFSKVSFYGKNLVRNRVVLSWIVGFMALGLAGGLPSLLREIGITDSLWLTFSKSFAMTFLVLSGLFIIQGVTGNIRISIGLKTPGIALLQFLAGFGIILIPLLLSVTFTELFNWGEVRFNLGDGLFQSVIFGFLVTFLFEAFPEEILFRGYIYSHLNIKYSKWLSGIMTVGLFLLLPITLMQFHKYILGQDIYLAGNYEITLGYLISILLFSLIVQYLRILSGSVWLGMGFHLAFVHLNKLMGPTEDKFIQLVNLTSDQPIQIVYIVSILVIALFLLAYPKLTKRSLNWKGRNLSIPE